MKKRILALSLSAVLLLTMLAACGDSGSQNSANPTGNPTNNPGSNPTQTVQPTLEPSPEPVQVDLAAFYLALTEAYPGRVPETPEQAYPDDSVSENFTAEDLKDARESLRQMGLDAYPGLSDIAAEQCLVYVSMMSFNGAEAVLVQVSSASDVEAVKTILQTRIDTQKSGGAWYPAAVESWENNSRIVSNGNYVMLVVSEDCDAIVADFNAVIADPSYVPAPNPDSRSDDPTDDPNDDPGGVVPGFGGVVVPGFGGGTEPGDDPSPTVPGGGVVLPGGGGVVLPGFPSGPNNPGTGNEETPVEPTGRTDADVNLEAFLWTIAEKYELPGLDLPPTDWVSGDIPGLVSIPCVQRVVAQGMMTPPVCKIVLIQVTDSSDVQKVCDALQAYINSKIETDAAYNVEDWRSASIEVQGNYIMMIAHSSHDSVAADFNALF